MRALLQLLRDEHQTSAASFGYVLALPRESAIALCAEMSDDDETSVVLHRERTSLASLSRLQEQHFAFAPQVKARERLWELLIADLVVWGDQKTEVFRAAGGSKRSVTACAQNCRMISIDTVSNYEEDEKT
jgi:hypothetical protein